MGSVRVRTREGLAVLELVGLRPVAVRSCFDAYMLPASRVACNLLICACHVVFFRSLKHHAASDLGSRVKRVRQEAQQGAT